MASFHAMCQCGRAFSMKVAFLAHRDKCEKAAVFGCSCGREFESRAALLVHEKTCAARERVCERCQKTFTSLSLFAAHEEKCSTTTPTPAAAPPPPPSSSPLSKPSTTTTSSAAPLVPAAVVSKQQVSSAPTVSSPGPSPSFSSISGQRGAPSPRAAPSGPKSSATTTSKGRVVRSARKTSGKTIGETAALKMMLQTTAAAAAAAAATTTTTSTATTSSSSSNAGIVYDVDGDAVMHSDESSDEAISSRFSALKDVFDNDDDNSSSSSSSSSSREARASRTKKQKVVADPKKKETKKKTTTAKKKKKELATVLVPKSSNSGGVSDWISRAKEKAAATTTAAPPAAPPAASQPAAAPPAAAPPAAESGPKRRRVTVPKSTGRILPSKTAKKQSGEQEKAAAVVAPPPVSAPVAPTPVVVVAAPVPGPSVPVPLTLVPDVQVVKIGGNSPRKKTGKFSEEELLREVQEGCFSGETGVSCVGDTPVQAWWFNWKAREDWASDPVRRDWIPQRCYDRYMELYPLFKDACVRKWMKTREGEDERLNDFSFLTRRSKDLMRHRQIMTIDSSDDEKNDHKKKSSIKVEGRSSSKGPETPAKDSRLACFACHEGDILGRSSPFCSKCQGKYAMDYCRLCDASFVISADSPAWNRVLNGFSYLCNSCRSNCKCVGCKASSESLVICEMCNGKGARCVSCASAMPSWEGAKNKDDDDDDDDDDDEDDEDDNDNDNKKKRKRSKKSSSREIPGSPWFCSEECRSLSRTELEEVQRWSASRDPKEWPNFWSFISERYEMWKNSLNPAANKTLPSGAFSSSSSGSLSAPSISANVIDGAGSSSSSLMQSQMRIIPNVFRHVEKTIYDAQELREAACNALFAIFPSAVTNAEQMTRFQLDCIVRVVHSKQADFLSDLRLSHADVYYCLAGYGIYRNLD